MFVLLDTNGNLLRPTPEASTAYNSYWYPGTAGTSGDFDFGSGCEAWFTCPACQRKVPNAFAQADHNFPDSLLKDMFTGANQNRYQQISNLAAQHNNNPMAGNGSWGNTLGETTISLPDFSFVQYYVLGYGETDKTFYETWRNDDEDDPIEILTATRVNGQTQFRFNVPAFQNPITHSLVDVACADHDNLCMICLACNQAKSNALYPAHEPFTQEVRQLPGANIRQANAMPTNQGVTYTVPPEGDCNNAPSPYQNDDDVDMQDEDT